HPGRRQQQAHDDAQPEPRARISDGRTLVAPDHRGDGVRNLRFLCPFHIHLIFLPLRSTLGSSVSSSCGSFWLSSALAIRSVFITSLASSFMHWIKVASSIVLPRQFPVCRYGFGLDPLTALGAGLAGHPRAYPISQLFRTCPVWTTGRTWRFMLMIMYFTVVAALS